MNDNWQKLRALVAQVAAILPGQWSMNEPPPFWMVILTRSDDTIRILVDDTYNIVVEVSDDGPLPPMGQSTNRLSHLLRFRTRHRDPTKIAALLVEKLETV